MFDTPAEDLQATDIHDMHLALAGTCNHYIIAVMAMNRPPFCGARTWPECRFGDCRLAETTSAQMSGLSSYASAKCRYPDVE